MPETVEFVVEEIRRLKVWDKGMAKPAADAFMAGVVKALGGSGGKVVKTVSKDAKGYKVTLTMENLELDKKGVLVLAVKGAITELPEDKYLAGITHDSKLPDANQKKIEADVKFLCDDSGQKLGAKIRKEIR